MEDWHAVGALVLVIPSTMLRLYGLANNKATHKLIVPLGSHWQRMTRWVNTDEIDNQKARMMK